MIISMFCFSIVSSPLFVISDLLVTIGGQLGWPRFFWQPATKLYLSHNVYTVGYICLYNVHVLWIVKSSSFHRVAKRTPRVGLYTFQCSTV